MTVEAASFSGGQAPKELVRSIDWRGAFWVASGVPAGLDEDGALLLRRDDDPDGALVRVVAGEIA